MPARRIDEIVHGQRRISADTALRLARYFGTSVRFCVDGGAGLAGPGAQLLPRSPGTSRYPRRAL